MEVKGGGRKMKKGGKEERREANPHVIVGRSGIVILIVSVFLREVKIHPIN